MQVFRLDRIIPPVHLFALVANDFHGGHRIHPCPPQIRTCRMPEVMNSQVRNPSSPAGCGEARANIFHRPPFIQEHLVRV